jgi:hypothetical protein
MRGLISTALVAVVVSIVASATVSALAQSQPSAVVDINAHRVDGKHAVGAGASIDRRAGKLVATNSEGYLPPNIVKPLWSSIQDVPGGFADGNDNIGYFSNVQFTQETPLAPGAEQVVFTFNWPIGWAVFWQVIPSNTGAGTEKLLLTERLERQANGNIQFWLTVRNDGDVASGYRLRYVAFDMGIAPASRADKSELADVEVKVRKAH